MSAIATSYWSHLSNGAIIFWGLFDLAVLIGVGFSRSKWMGFVCGGFSGLVFCGIDLYESGEGPFALFFDGPSIVLLAAVNANLGMLAAKIGDFLAIKAGKEPRERF